MQVITNEPLVKRNRKIATYLFFVSLGILGFGFIAINTNILGIRSTDAGGAIPTLYIVGMPLIIVIGFITTLISVRMTNMWLRMPRPEDVIKENLKGLSSKSRLYNYFHFPARHVLICPHGVFAIITRYHDGAITVSGDKWKRKRSPLSSLLNVFRLDDIGNPAREAQEAANHIRAIIEDYDQDLPVQPIVIFTSPKAKLELNNSTVPVFYADIKATPNFKNHLRDLQKFGQMKGPENLDEFIEEFEAATLDY